MIRYVTRISVAYLFLFFSSISFSQAPTFKIYPEQVTGNQGDTVEFKVVASNYNKVVGIQFEIRWDITQFEILSNVNELAKNANPVLENCSNCFAIKNKQSVLMSSISSEIGGNTINPNEDSTFFRFKMLIKSNVTNASICFGNSLLPEVTYHNKFNECVSLGATFTCNVIKFIDYILVSQTEITYLFYSPNEKIVLRPKIINGVKPLFFDWGKNNHTDSLVVSNPKSGDKYSVFIKDSGTDSVTVNYTLIKQSLNFNKVVSYPEAATLISVKIDPNFGKAPYTFDWKTLSNSTSDNAVVYAPFPSSPYTIKVSDSEGVSALYNLTFAAKVPDPLSFDIVSRPSYKLYLGDSVLYLESRVYGGVPAYRFLWSNGDTTPFINKLNIKGTNVVEIGLKVTDSRGIEASKNFRIVRDSIQRLKCLTKELPYNGGNINFDRNPISGMMKLKLNYVRDKVSIKTDSVEIYNQYTVNFKNESMTKEVDLYVTYSYDHPDYHFKDSTVIIKIKKAPAPPLSIDLPYNYYSYCTPPNNILILKATAKGGVPPYYYDWGNEGASIDLTWIPIQPTQSAVYPITITDAAGQVAKDSIIVRIGDVSEIYSLKPDVKPTCSFSLEGVNNIMYTVKKSNYYTPFNISVSLFSHDNKLIRTGTYYRDFDSVFNIYLAPHTELLDRNINPYKFVVGVKAIGNNSFCAPKTNIEFYDTVVISPLPKFLPYNTIDTIVCNKTIISSPKPVPDPTNLPDAELIWYKKEFSSSNFETSKKFSTSNSPIQDTAHVEENYNRKIYTLGAKLRYKSTGCYSDDVYDTYYVYPEIKPDLYVPNSYISIKSGDSVKISNYGVNCLDPNAKHIFTYLHNNLSGTLFNDKTFPLSGTVVNNTAKTEKLALIVESSFYGCKGGRDTVYIEVKNGLIENDIERTTTDEKLSGGKLQLLNLQKDDLGLPIEYTLFPNPTSDQLNLHFKAIREQKSVVEILSMTGIRVLHYPFDANKGLNYLNFDISQLIPDTYLLTLKNDDNFLSKRFIVKK